MDCAQRRPFVPLFAVGVLAIAGCASVAPRDNHAIIVVATPPPAETTQGTRYYTELYSAHMKKIDGEWVTETTRHPGKQILELEPGAYQLELTATLSEGGAYRRPAAERAAAERRPPPSREVNVQIEAGKRYYIAAHWPEGTMPDAWEPVVWWEEDI